MGTSQIYPWKETKLYENLFKDMYKNFKKIVDLKIGTALPPGENYTTIILKIEIKASLENGETRNKNFMLKIAHDSEFYRQEMSKLEMFNVESFIYHKIKPELENLYKEVSLDIQFGAASYKLPTDQDYLLLEDLTERGFRNANRLEGLDMEHCKAVLKKIAQWHAASAVSIERNGLYDERYTRGIRNKNGRKLIATLLSTSFKHILKAAKKLKDHKEYLEQIASLESKIVDKFFKDLTPNENEFNVLNHGDFWCNNIMFQYNENGKLLDTYFVDYQILSYGSPAQDLLCFIITSAQLDIKIDKFDYMIKYYHDNLVKHLTLLKYKKQLPSLKEIHQSIIKYSLWGFFATFIILPAVLADSNKDATADNLVGANEESDKFKELIFSNERITKNFEILLPWLCYRGVFEN